MRKDIRHVVVERPRTGGHYTKGDRKRFDWQDKSKEPPSNNESMRRRYIHGFGGKQRTDYLAPLKRFLYKSVGRPWDKIYSEICQNLRLDSAQQRHVRQHVFDYVYLDIRIREDGAVCRPAHRNFYGETWTVLRQGDLYVCPRTQLLKKVKRQYDK